MLLFTSHRLGTLFVLLTSSRAALAQTPVDSGLAAYIATIRAIDNHAHPMRPVAAGAPADSEYDALPLDGIPPFPIPWRLTLAAPVWSRAARVLYGSQSADVRAGARYARGERFPAWVLDRAGIDVMLANRIAMGPGLAPPRFRWVPFDDALLFPLDTRLEATRTPDT